jgi:hypothetical protein
MTGVSFLAAFLTLPALGAGLLLSRRFDWLPGVARIAASVAVGSVVLCGEMIALTILGMRWSLSILLAVPLVMSAWALSRRGATRPFSFAEAHPGRIDVSSALLLLIAAAALAFLAFAALTARVTSADLLLFWAAKGEHFGLVGAIDPAFLGDPNHSLLHSDYPPLWPCLFAFGVLFAGRFAWGAALATLPFFLLLSVIAIWFIARLRVSTRAASAFAALYASMFGFLLADSLTAGNADSPLLFFETLALSLLIFAPEERGSFLLVGIALAGATLLKLEGTAFSWAVIIGCLLLVRPLSWRRVAQLVGPPIVAFVGWYAFCRAHGLIDFLGTHKPLVLTGERFGVIARGMLSAARLQSGYLPWMVVLFLIVVRKTARAASFALLVAALVAAFDCGIYLTISSDPTLWIGWAGQRTLLTPLLALLIAGMASPASRLDPDDRARVHVAARKNW